MDGVGALVNSGLGDVTPEMLIITPIAVGVSLALWGIPRLVRFGKRVAG